MSAAWLSTKRFSSATAIFSAKPMPTKPPVATVSPSRIRRTASRAETTLPASDERRAAVIKCTRPPISIAQRGFDLGKGAGQFETEHRHTEQAPDMGGREQPAHPRQAA